MRKLILYKLLSNRVFANAQDRVTVPFLLSRLTPDRRLADIESPLRQMLFRNNGTPQICLATHKQGVQ
jgi:hypothetical protein